MDQPTKQKEKPRLNVGFGIGLGEYTAAIIVGVVSGVLTAGKTIRDKFLDDVKRATDFEQFFKDQASNLSKIHLPEILKSEPEGPEEVRKLSAFKTYAGKIIDKKKNQAIDLDKKLTELRGVRKELIAGTFDRAALMSRRSVNSILLRSALGIAVGAGAMLSFFNGIATRAKIEAIDNAVESDLANQPADQKPLAFKDRKPLPPKALEKNDDKTAAHAEKVAAEAATGKPAKEALREKYEELKEDAPKVETHVEKIGDAIKEERPKSHVEKLAASADTQDLQVAAR